MFKKWITVPENTVPEIAVIKLFDLNTVSVAQLSTGLDLLSEQERSRYQRFAKALHQRQFLAGRLLLRQSVAQLVDVPVGAIAVTEQPQRAPLLHIAGLASAPGFSLSHTGSWVACAVSRSTQLGLDIELLNQDRNLASLAERIFQADELTWLADRPDRVSAFYQLWSRREARYKLTQSHNRRSDEHAYALSHPAVSMVLMSERALSAAPEWSGVTWSELQSVIRSGRIR